jgi:branched-chain amino acid transport system substrate-binding protein
LLGQPARAQDTAPREPEKHGATPERLRPFGGVGEPYKRFFVDPPEFRGPGREDPEPQVDEVRIGVIAPLAGPERVPGKRMVNGITLAVEEANAAGGYKKDVPFKILVRDETSAWGAAADAGVELLYDHGVWALVGGLADEASHVLTRVLLKLEVPNLNVGGSDPTLTEHMIPWVVRTRPDDRQNGYRLAKKVFEEDGHRRVAMLRANDRYGRVGTVEFKDAARRLGRPILLETRYVDGESDWKARMERLRAVRPDAIVVWGRAVPTGHAVKALRDAGLKVPVYGPDRLLDPDFLKAAGKAAEGVVFTHPFDPKRDRESWKAFRDRYRARFGEEPEAMAAIRDAGLNRPLIRDRLYAKASFQGVAGTVRFDASRNNVSPMFLGRVEKGEFVLE